MIQQIVTFEGGLSTKKLPHLIARNEAIVCTNVDLETGGLTPLKSFIYVDNVAGKHIYPYNDLIISNATDVDDRFYDTFGGRLYWSNAEYSAYGLMRYDGTDAGVNAEAPSPLSTAETTSIAITESATAGRLTIAATYTYAFTVVDTDGIESTPEVHITSVTLTGNKQSMLLSISYADMTTIETNHPDMAGLNIYRTGGDNPTFNVIATNMLKDHPDVIDTGTHYTWYDKVADIDVSRTELYTFENNAPSAGLDKMIESNGTLWGAIGTNVYFSRTGSPEYWGLLDYITLDKECTGLGKFGGSVVAFTRTSAYLINGSTRDDVNVQRLPFNQGCIEGHSIVNIDSYLLWTSLNGVCIFNGATIDVITKDILSWDEFGRVGEATYGDYDTTTSKWDSSLGFDIRYAESYQDRYYGVYSDGILVIDLSNGTKVSTIGLTGVVSLAVNDEDNLLYAVVPNATSGFDVYYLPSSGDSSMTATWKTSRIDDASTNIQKHYRDVTLEAMPVSVEVFVDGESVKVYTGRQQFKLPAGSFGKDIQFEIVTTNEIRSLKYKYSEMKA